MKRRLLRLLSALVILATFLFVIAYFVFQSQWLREQIRTRAIFEIEKATGGRAEIGHFDFSPGSWTVTFDNFVLHGTEPATAAPLFRAPKITVGLKILSFLNRNVDLQSIDVLNPELHILRRADGTTNLPSPAHARSKSGRPLAEILKLAIDEFTVRNGTFTYEQRTNPFTFSGRELEAKLNFVADAQRYDGALRSRAFTLDIPDIPKFEGDFSSEVSLYENSLSIHKLHAEAGRHIVDATGAIMDLLEPKVTLKLSARSNLGYGPMDTAGVFTYSTADRYRYEGEANGRGLAYEGFTGINARAHILLNPEGIQLSKVNATAAQGQFAGDVALADFKTLAAKGTVSGLSLESLVKRGYSGTISGPVELTGPLKGPYSAIADITIAPGTTGIPVEGTLHVRYDQAKNLIDLGDSYLATSNTRVALSGTLNQTIRVKASTRRLEDILPALDLESLPIALAEAGDITFEGTVTGEAKSPQIAGQVIARKVKYDKYLIDAATATVVASASHLDITRLTAEAEKAQIDGSASLALTEWKPNQTAPLTARLNVRNLNFKLIPGDLPAVGFLSATTVITGTLNNPDITGNIESLRPIIRDEALDRVRASGRFHASTLELQSLEATRGAAKLTASGRATENGPFTADVALTGVSLADWQDLRKLRSDLTGNLRATAKLSGVLRGRDPLLQAVDIDAGLRELAVAKKPIGEVTLQGKTQANTFAFTLLGKLREAEIKGSGAYKLEPGYPGSATFSLATVPLSIVNDFRPEPLPFIGSLSASAKVSGPAFDPEKWKADLTVPTLSVRAARRQRITNTASTTDFELRNDGPLEFSADGGVITVKQARFVAKDTNLSAAGTFSLAKQRPWDLRVNGSLNLAGLKTFSPDIQAGGIALLEANIRGVLDTPQVFGRLDLKDASLFIDDVPSGLDKVTGRIIFDRSRATIENKLTAQSGGGDLALSGFVDFGDEEAFYRLQATARGVRVRYPEGLSTVADGSISLTGSPTQSLLAGNITIQRSGFQPRTDLGSLLSDATKGEQTPVSTNEFLTNMQLDIRVQTAPNTQFTTSLTSDLSADANLNVRGSAVRPVVQGRIAVNQGEVNFFGSKYTIKRGEISFYNTSKIEPVLDMDVETRIRAVTVGINFSGPVNKLNVSYRSDPPLAPAEIIALLTVGRSPDSQSYSSPGAASSSSLFQTGANTLLGNAISAPISSQLQRFFGVSRIKIDPLISGLEGTPQARLTVEQQVSKDITVTFVTTLNRSQQQVVRLEWNLSKEWSVIALRDENGSFGLDFQLRKQVK